MNYDDYASIMEVLATSAEGPEYCIFCEVGVYHKGHVSYVCECPNQSCLEPIPLREWRALEDLWLTDEYCIVRAACAARYGYEPVMIAGGSVAVWREHHEAR